MLAETVSNDEWIVVRNTIKDECATQNNGAQSNRMCYTSNNGTQSTMNVVAKRRTITVDSRGITLKTLQSQRASVHQKIKVI